MHARKNSNRSITRRFSRSLSMIFSNEFRKFEKTWKKLWVMHIQGHCSLICINSDRNLVRKCMKFREGKLSVKTNYLSSLAIMNLIISSRGNDQIKRCIGGAIKEFWCLGAFFREDFGLTMAKYIMRQSQ